MLSWLQLIRISLLNLQFHRLMSGLFVDLVDARWREIRSYLSDLCSFAAQLFLVSKVYCRHYSLGQFKLFIDRSDRSDYMYGSRDLKGRWWSVDKLDAGLWFTPWKPLHTIVAWVVGFLEESKALLHDMCFSFDMWNFSVCQLSHVHSSFLLWFLSHLYKFWNIGAQDSLV